MQPNLGAKLIKKSQQNQASFTLKSSKRCIKDMVKLHIISTTFC